MKHVRLDLPLVIQILLSLNIIMISLGKCTGSCNVLSPKIYVPKETKDINAKAFNMITNKNEPKIYFM